MFEQLFQTLINKRKYQRKIEDCTKNQKNIICVTRKVKDKLDNSFVIQFSFISNFEITGYFLCNDGVHIKEEGTCILSSNFVNFLNDYILCIQQK